MAIRIDPKSDSYSALMWDVITNCHHYVPRPGDRVLDLGAHFGMFSLYCAARGATVVAYEPTPHSFGELIYTAAVAHDISPTSLEPINCAVGGKNGFREFFLSTATSAQNTFLDRPDNGLVITVPVVDLKTAFRAHNNYEWDCVKVDIEGAEYETFMAADSEDFSKIRFLTMEIHNDLLPKDQIDELVARLEKEFPRIHKIMVKRNGVTTDIVATILCWRDRT